MSLTGLLTSSAAPIEPKIIVRDTGAATASNGASTYVYVDWEVGDLVLVAQHNGTVSSAYTGNVRLHSPSSTSGTEFSVLYDNYSNDTYDTHSKFYGWIATAPSTDYSNRIYCVGSGYTVTAMVNQAIVIKGGSFNGVLPNTSDGSLITNSGFNSANITWGTLTETNPNSLHILMGGAAHVLNTRHYPDPGDLDYFLSTSRADSYDITGALGYKYTSSDWSPSLWDLNVGYYNYRSSRNYVIFKIRR
jgi:hypothetical protein